MKNIKYILVPFAFATVIATMEITLFPADYKDEINFVKKEAEYVMNFFKNAETKLLSVHFEGGEDGII